LELSRWTDVLCFPIFSLPEVHEDLVTMRILGVEHKAGRTDLVIGRDLLTHGEFSYYGRENWFEIGFEFPSTALAYPK